MNEKIIVQAIKELMDENIRFGSCSVEFTFHDGKPVFYEVKVSKRINIKTKGSSGTECRKA